MTRARRPTEHRTPAQTNVPYLFGPAARQSLLLAYASADPGTPISFDIGLTTPSAHHAGNEMVVLVSLDELRVGFTPTEARIVARVTEEALKGSGAAEAGADLARRMADLVVILRYAADRAEQREKPN